MQAFIKTVREANTVYYLYSYMQAKSECTYM